MSHQKARFHFQNPDQEMYHPLTGYKIVPATFLDPWSFSEMLCLFQRHANYNLVAVKKSKSYELCFQKLLIYQNNNVTAFQQKSAWYTATHSAEVNIEIILQKKKKIDSIARTFDVTIALQVSFSRNRQLSKMKTLWFPKIQKKRNEKTNLKLICWYSLGKTYQIRCLMGPTNSNILRNYKK